MQLLIFEAIRFGGRYRYFGGGTRESGCGTYQYSEPDHTLVVVSGENAGGAVRCTLRVNRGMYKQGNFRRNSALYYRGVSAIIVR